MNFSICNFKFSISSVLIFYIITALLGTFIIYNFGLKSDWQKLRLSKGLCINGNMLSPSFNTKTITNESIFCKICIKLVILSLTISALINVSHYLINEELRLNSVRSYIINGMNLLLLYSIFAGVPLETKEIDSSIYQPVMNAMSKIKNQILETAIISEEDYYYRYLQNVFKEWIINKDNDRLLTFVAAINERFFNQVFSNALTEEKQAHIVLCIQDIGESYVNSNILLNEQLIRVFGKDLVQYGAHLSLIVQLIYNHNEKTFSDEEISTAKQTLDTYRKEVNSSTIEPPIDIDEDLLNESIQRLSELINVFEEDNAM